MPNWIKELFDDEEGIDLGTPKTGTVFIVDGTEWVVTSIQFGRRTTSPFGVTMQMHFAQKKDYYR